MARVLAVMAPKASTAPGAPASISVAARVGTFMRMVGVANTSTFAEDFAAQCAQDWTTARQRFHIMYSRNGVTGVEPPAEMDGIVLRSLAHPLRVDGGTFNARDDGCIRVDGVHVRDFDPHGSGSAQLDHLHGGVEGRPHFRIGAVEEEVGGNADPHPAYVSVERSFVVRDGLGRGRRIGWIMAGDGAKQSRAIAGCPRKRPDVVRGEAKRHGAVARHARLRALDAGYAAHGRRQPDGAARVRPERPIDEAGGDRRARPRRGAARAIVDMPGVAPKCALRPVGVCANSAILSDPMVIDPASSSRLIAVAV